MEEYKSNSNKQKEAKKVERVTTGTIRTKKKSDVRKLADVFVSEDMGNVKSYILMDVLVPAIKKAISDIVTNGIDMVLYGETKKTTNSSKVSYRSYYNKDDGRKNNDRSSSRNRSGYDYDEIILDNRGDAEDVLTNMDDLISKYGMVSVGDLYDLVGVTGNYTDEKYGWTDLRDASVIRIRDGYVLKLPKALPLN